MTLFAIVLLCYFIPCLVAGYRQHPNGAGIAVLNLFLGWTFVGWVVALIWSLSAQPTRERVVTERERQWWRDAPDGS